MKRGEIYYIDRTYEESENEIRRGRPGIIVSNDACSDYRYTAQVVFLTTSPRANLPTHVAINSTGRQSTALCEQISTVSATHIGQYVGSLSEEEMEEVNKALAISLGLPSAKSSTNQSESITKIIAERDAYKKICNDIIGKIGTVKNS